MGWLRAGLGALRASVKVAALLAGLKSFAASRLKASARALRKELEARGLPTEAVEELVEKYVKIGREIIRASLSLTGLVGPLAPWPGRSGRRRRSPLLA